MYVDAELINERIYVSSYDDQGRRHITTHLPPYVFYYLDKNGSYTSIYGDPLNRKRYNDRKKFHIELQKHDPGSVFESDVPPIFRFLEERYPGDETPPLKVCFLDIEADKDPSKGWTSVRSPYAPINAVTVYRKWEQQFYTIAVPPPGVSRESAINILASDSEKDSFGPMTEDGGFLVAHSESELLSALLELIADADVLSGWNSTFFDIPYIIQRLRMVFGGEKLKALEREDGSERYPYNPSFHSKPYLEKLCLFPKIPSLRMVERYGNFEKTFDICGRVHLDYLELYRKFTFEELHSYTLDTVLRKEIGQSKVVYEGTLDQLYRNDFRTFVAYNRQDVAGLSKLDDSKKMIELANKMAHMAGVTFDKVTGSVSIIEQAILKTLHKQNRICFNKDVPNEKEAAPGAYVVLPEKGLYEWVCSFDINSLYPSVIRALNISPEVVVGQFDLTRTEEKLTACFNLGMSPTEAWGQFTGVYEYHDLIDEKDEMLTLVLEATEEEITAPAKEWKRILKENNWSVSANGTVFDLSQEGIVAVCLTEWYKDRVEFQKQKKEAGKAQETEEDEKKVAELKMAEEYYDMVQQVMKIFLNSTYGAYLNRFFRFYDPRLGRSVTLSGRVITKHMLKCASEIITGNYDFDRRAIIYGDTDSAYCTLDWYMGQHNIEKNDQNTIEISDKIGEQINATFPKFMKENFLVDSKRGEIIRAGREVVARRGLFKDKKKRYALHVIDKEGKKKDDVEIKGMETRRTDTPRFMQDFLEKCITAVVKDKKSYNDVYEMVEDFRKEFRQMPPWERGTPCRVSNLTLNAAKLKDYYSKKKEGFVDIKKPVPHYSVVAATNTNMLIEQFDERSWDYIHDGDKVEVLYLRSNPQELRSVAINVDSKNYVPQWFKELPFDNEAHEQKLIDKKMFNVLGEIMGWSFEPIKDYRQEVFEEKDFFA